MTTPVQEGLNNVGVMVATTEEKAKKLQHMRHLARYCLEKFGNTSWLSRESWIAYSKTADLQVIVNRYAQTLSKNRSAILESLGRGAASDPTILSDVNIFKEKAGGKRG